MICPVWQRVKSEEEFELLRVYTGICKPAVKVGAKVEASSVIGHCEVSAGQRLVKVAQVLGVPRSQVKKYLLRNIGDRIYQGEIVARKKGIFGVGKEELRSPADGVITDINSSGDIIIKFLPTPVRLVAGANGVISKIGEEGISVKTFGTEIEAVAGIGRPREGIIKIVAKPDEFIIPQVINATCTDKILVGGALLERAAIEKAVTLGVRGIICGGINYRDFLSLGLASDVGVTILVTEGFGAVSMGADIFNALNHLVDHFAFVAGPERTLHIPQEKGEKVAKTFPPQTWRELKVGDKVRLFRRNSNDLVGTVEKIGDKEETLENGLVAETADVKFISGDSLRVPAANLEIVE